MDNIAVYRGNALPKNIELLNTLRFVPFENLQPENDQSQTHETYAVPHRKYSFVLEKNAVKTLISMNALCPFQH